MKDVADQLLEQIAIGYKPTLPLDIMLGVDGMPIYTIRRDIEWMCLHPVVCITMGYYESGINGAEFLIKTANQEVGDFVLAHCKKFWDRGVHGLQHNGYKYGWAAGENRFVEEMGRLCWDGLDPFSSRDVYMLTQGHVPVGVRVKNVLEKATVDLWLSTGDLPSKALWYSHRPETSSGWYGQSQLMGAWRPWRRLAWKDGAETSLDGGIYRLAYHGPIIYYPEEDMQGPPGSPNTTLDSQGNPRRFARDIARQIGEMAKTGAAIGFPSTCYPKESGGMKKWEMIWPSQVLNVDPIINYVKNLHDQIMFGIGVPPELILAAETGSGYSGRRIPLEAFLDGQQRIAGNMLRIFVDYVVKPLVRWNFGDVPFEVNLKRLLQSKTQATEGMSSDKGIKGADQSPPEQKPQQPQAMLSYHDLVTDRIRGIAVKVLRRAA